MREETSGLLYHSWHTGHFSHYRCFRDICFCCTNCIGDCSPRNGAALKQYGNFYRISPVLIMSMHFIECPMCRSMLIRNEETSWFIFKSMLLYEDLGHQCQKHVYIHLSVMFPLHFGMPTDDT